MRICSSVYILLSCAQIFELSREKSHWASQAANLCKMREQLKSRHRKCKKKRSIISICGGKRMKKIKSQKNKSKNQNQEPSKCRNPSLILVNSNLTKIQSRRKRCKRHNPRDLKFSLKISSKL